MQSFSHDYEYVDHKRPYHYVLKRSQQDIKGIEENKKEKLIMLSLERIIKLKLIHNKAKEGEKVITSLCHNGFVH